jgi:hypothetical protein
LNSLYQGKRKEWDKVMKRNGGEMGWWKLEIRTKVFPKNLNWLFHYPCYKTDVIKLIITSVLRVTLIWTSFKRTDRFIVHLFQLFYLSIWFESSETLLTDCGVAMVTEFLPATRT